MYEFNLGTEQNFSTRNSNSIRADTIDVSSIKIKTKNSSFRQNFHVLKSQ